MRDDDVGEDGLTGEGDLQVGSDAGVGVEPLRLNRDHCSSSASVGVERVDNGVVAAGDLLPLVDDAGEVVPGVDGECVVLATGSALAGQAVVVGGKAEVETRGQAVVWVSEDVEGGSGMHGLPHVGVVCRDGVEVSFGSDVSPLQGELRHGMIELV